jgi:hypothetical protein
MKYLDISHLFQKPTPAFPVESIDLNIGKNRDTNELSVLMTIKSKGEPIDFALSTEQALLVHTAASLCLAGIAFRQHQAKNPPNKN